MSVCNVQTLLSRAACFACGPPPELTRLALLATILKTVNPKASTDVNTLLLNARVFSGSSPGEVQLLRLQMLCNILGFITAPASVCVNLIPQGSTYIFGLGNQFQVNLIANKTYKLTAGVNEQAWANGLGGQNPIANGQTVTFVADPASPILTLISNGINQPVTAIVCQQ